MYKILPILLFAYGLAVTTDDIYDNSYALIIGIDKYENVSNLDYAVKDAHSVASLLKDNFNFPSENVKILLNDEATLTNFKNSLEEISLSAKVNDRVLIYFAGHGETDDLPDGGEMGYLLPIDGKRDRLFSTSVPMDDLKRISSMSESKHMLFLIDACYGGLAATGARGLSSTTPNYIAKITHDKSRQIITAGGRGEQVIEKSEWGHSAFTMNLIRALENGKGDLNADGYITGDELGVFLKEKVTIDSENQQTPQSRRFTSHEGEFVFINNAYIKKQIINITPEAGNDDIRDIDELRDKIASLEEQLSKPVKFIQGCTDEAAINYNPDANIDDDSCIILEYGDAYIQFGNFNESDSTLEAYITTLRTMYELDFKTQGFIMEQLTGGMLLNNGFVHTSLNSDNGSWFYATSSIGAIGTRSIIYGSQLLFKAKILPKSNTFCFNDVKSKSFDQILIGECIMPNYKTYWEESGEIYFTSNVPIYYFNFRITGVEVIGAHGGAVGETGLDIRLNDNVIEGYSLTQQSIPPGNGKFIILDINGHGKPCIDEMEINRFGVEKNGFKSKIKNISISNCVSIEVRGDDIYGCTNQDACNYDSEATNDDGSCEYPEEYYDCDGNCTVGLDCKFECGGNSRIDKCGVCGGDGSSCK